MKSDVRSALKTLLRDKLFYISDGTDQRGPFTFNQLSSLWKNGQITADSFYMVQDDSEWIPIMKISDILSQDSSSDSLVIHSQMKSQGFAFLLALLFPGLGGLYSGFFTFAFGIAASIVFAVGFFQRDFFIYWFIAIILYMLAIVSCFHEVSRFNQNLIKDR